MSATKKVLCAIGYLFACLLISAQVNGAGLARLLGILPFVWMFITKLIMKRDAHWNELKKQENANREKEAELLKTEEEQEERKKALDDYRDYLQGEKDALVEKINRVNETNAKIQKNIFERGKNLEPQEKELAVKFKELEEWEAGLSQFKMDNEKHYSEWEEKLIAWEKELNEKAEEISNNTKRIAKVMEEEETRLDIMEKHIKERAEQIDAQDRAIFQEAIENVGSFLKRPEMNGYEFEKYVGMLLDVEGFENIQVTQKSNDYGADVVAEKNGFKYAFQCKYYNDHPVGVSAVQEISSAMRFYNAHFGVVVTNSTFTPNAKTLSSKINIVLWDGEYLEGVEKRIALRELRERNRERAMQRINGEHATSQIGEK